ncbi:MAG: HlyD family efflux transporter periplasmic adaptor subunit [Planctomycetes bacterium]|nr:HlyD family efflux transporter periplasmic adaptor subunit [Planctomycetota bacterium]
MRKLAPALFLLLTFSSLAIAQEERGEAEALSGRLQPAQATELKLELKAYGGELTLKSMLAPGMTVKRGEVVAEVSAPEYEDAVMRARENVRLSEMALQLMQEAANSAQESYKLQLERTQRAAQRAEQDLEYFLKVQKQQTIRNSELGLESFDNNIKDQEEELAQLEKLYQGNDLAKESQDIVLNRSRRRLANSKERYEMVKEEHKRLLEVGIVRREEDLRAARDSAAFELARVSSSVTRDNVDLQSKLIRSQRGLEDARKALADLEADAGRFKLLAPHDGAVAAGAWNNNDGASQAVRVGDKLGRGAVLATVVDTGKLTVNVNVQPGSRDKFKAGTQVNVKAGETSAPGVVKAIGFVVNKAGMVTAVIEVDNSAGALLPGQKVNVALP